MKANISPGAIHRTKPSPEGMENDRAPKIITRKPLPASRLASNTSNFYSLQIATCRMKSCKENLVLRLREKGFQPIVSHMAFSSPAMTEVILGEFSTEKAARSHAAFAEGKKIEISTYTREGKWGVSAGRFADATDAAQRLEELKEAGLDG